MVRSRWSFSEWVVVIKQCVVSEENNAHSFFSFDIPLLSNRQIWFSCQAEVEKTGMIGALPVLVPGWGGACVHAMCGIWGM